MVRPSSVYVCQNCGQEFPKWSGQCAGCGTWNSLVETAITPSNSRFKSQSRQSGAKIGFAQPIKLSEIKSQTVSRISSGIDELDRVLGGGIVPGSVVLVAGSPGMGKSTLLTQLALSISGSKRQDTSVKEETSRLQKKELETWNLKLGPTVIYVCGEESPNQVKLRVDRLLGEKGKLPENFFLLPETNTESIIASLEQQHPDLVIVDSIQTVWTERLTGVAGSVGQVRESAQMLLQFAKSQHVPIFLVGHVTKEGAIAGPKVLEHLVDVVLSLEGDGKHEFRLLRGAKNRFGNTDEVGVFMMQDSGMKEVTNPSEIFLPDMVGKPKPGSVVVAAMQGARPVLVEIQALVTTTTLAMPRRVATGLDQRRLQVLCAILQKHVGLRLSDKDVYVNVAGGLTLKEPAADLGICLAIASSYSDKAVKEGTVAIGEVGLLGEIRRVAFMEKRLKEAKSQGYTQTVSSQITNFLPSLLKSAFSSKL